jgi:hypothetical protein
MAFSLRILCAIALATAIEALSGSGVGPNLRLRGGGKHYPKMPDSIKPGVLYGQALKDLLQHAKDNCYAIPAVNCISSSSVNQVLEAAKKYNSPVMIQFSNGGAQFYAGKSIPNSKEKQEACVLGAIAVCFISVFLAFLLTRHYIFGTPAFATAKRKSTRLALLLAHDRLCVLPFHCMRTLNVQLAPQ